MQENERQLINVISEIVKALTRGLVVQSMILVIVGALTAFVSHRIKE